MATTIGSSTAGSVPNTNSRITSAPTPPIDRLDQHARAAADPCFDASPSASRPVTSTVMPAGRPFAAAARIVSAPLGTSSAAGRPGTPRRTPCGGRPTRTRGCRSRSRSCVRAPGHRRPPHAAIACSIASLFVASPVVWKTTTLGVRAPAPRAVSARWLASYAGLPGTAMLWYQRVDTCPAAKAPKTVRSEPGGDHRPAAADGQVCKAGQHRDSWPADRAITQDPAFASGGAGTIGRRSADG